MITVHVRIHDWVIDLAHLIMHRIKVLIAMIAVSVISFKAVEHLFSRFKLLKVFEVLLFNNFKKL
jgi:hypothetical protein